jgi:hypothetical protein
VFSYDFDWCKFRTKFLLYLLVCFYSYFPLTEPVTRLLIDWFLLTEVCPVIECSSFWWAQLSRSSSYYHLKMGTEPVLETLCFVTKKMMDKVQKALEQCSFLELCTKVLSIILFTIIFGKVSSNYVTTDDNSAFGLYGKFVILCSLSRDCSKSPVRAWS